MFDVAVIGAGVVGALAARELSRYAVKTVLLEKADDVAMGASKANSAIVHAGFDCIPGTLMAKMNVKGNAMMETVAAELSVPFKRNGSMVLAFGPEDEKTLADLKERGEKNGVPGLKILSGDEARALEPKLSPDVTAARELEEETGYKAARVEHMYTMYPTPGYTDEKIYIYRAYTAEEGESHPDDGEFVAARFYPVEEVKDMIERGEIKDAKTIIAVFSYLLSQKK